MKYMTTIGEREFMVEILDDDHVSVDGRVYSVDFDSISDQPVFSLLLDGHSFEAYVYPADQAWQVLLKGRSYQALVEEEFHKRLRIAAGSKVGEQAELNLKSPMPGLIVAISVVEGQEVSKGDVMVILESMKMQNELKSPRDGVVGRLRVNAGDSVEQNQVLLSLS